MSGGLLNVEIASLPVGYKGDLKEGEILTFSEKFACPVTGFTLTEIEPRIFSFNSPYGACSDCDGLGNEVFFDPNLVIPDKTLSIKEGAISPWHKSSSKYSNTQNRYYTQTLAGLADHFDFSLYTPYRELSEEIQDVLLYGTDEEITFKYD
jgi:excinuclease ABC subunit A